MKSHEFDIRDAKPEEFEIIGKLMVNVYAQIVGFPKEKEQPNYYNKLLKVGQMTQNENTALIVAIGNKEEIVGAVVYFSDMKEYGSGGLAVGLIERIPLGSASGV